MPSIKDSEVQKLHRAVSQRETQYLQIINDHLPSRLSNLIENNFFTSIGLYTFLLILSFFLSIFRKTSETDVVEETKKIAAQTKQKFVEERDSLTKDFGKTLEDAKAQAADKLNEAQKNFAKTLEDAKAQAADKLSEAQKNAKAATEELEAQLESAKKTAAKQAQKELHDAKAEFERQSQAAKKSLDDSTVRISDLHYQIAEKDKKIHALESVEHHLNRELEEAKQSLHKEREMHESSRQALHDAVEKLIQSRQRQSVA